MKDNDALTYNILKIPVALHLCVARVLRSRERTLVVKRWGYVSKVSEWLVFCGWRDAWLENGKGRPS